MLYDKASTRVDEAYIPLLASIYYDKKCFVCGDEFKSIRLYGRYCSLRCRNDAYIKKRRKRMETKRAMVKTCFVCAAPISQGQGKIKTYCSTACKQKAYRMRKAALPEVTKPEK